MLIKTIWVEGKSLAEAKNKLEQTLWYISTDGWKPYGEPVITRRKDTYYIYQKVIKRTSNILNGVRYNVFYVGEYLKNRKMNRRIEA